MIAVAGGDIQIVSATNQGPSGGGVGAVLTGGGTWLEVDGKVVSGSPDLKQLGSSVTLTTVDGKTIEVSANSNTKPIWWFIVPAESHHLTMNFPGGVSVSLDSILP